MLAVWALWGLDCLAVLATYARVPVGELYHVSHGGLGGGLGRVLVLLNFPIALVAIALVLIAMDALSPGAWWVGGPAIALCAVVAAPGVVDQADLDPKPVNALPAIGVALALGLALAAATRARRPPAGAGHTILAFVAMGLLLVFSLPWLATELGFHLPGGVFLTSEQFEGHAAVHLGHHHGLDGTLLAVSALVLWPLRLASPRLDRVTHAYLALMLAYGLVNATQDFWTEQVYKRGWSGGLIPDTLHPAVSWPWLVIASLAAASYALAGRRSPARP